MFRPCRGKSFNFNHFIVNSNTNNFLFLDLKTFWHLDFYQVKATAENVDEAVRELPDANLVRYSFHSMLGLRIS